MANSSFSINANTCTLLSDKNETSILGSKKYTIPIYQRPYSWGEEQINRFIKNIVKAYTEGEAYFLGTIQTMPPNDGKPSYTIIDGQQRLTTLLLMFKVLYIEWNNIPISQKITNWDWLKTEVNKQKQQEYLEQVLHLNEIKPAIEGEVNLNIYLRNIRWIRELLLELSSKEGQEEDEKTFEINKDFITYCSSQLFFVVIETQASLSKTLDIFNTINTAGMDLNGGDLFKIQMFDYLTRIKGEKDIVFDQIDELYASIDEANKVAQRAFCSVESVLTTYKLILIEKNKASRVLHTKGQDTFYEQLFEVVLLDEKHTSFDKSKFINALDLNTLERLVETRAAWEKLVWQCENNRFIHKTNVFLIWWSRYSSFLELDYIYIYKFYSEDFGTESFDKFTALLTKYFIIQSIFFKKAVNAAKTFCYDLIRLILDENSTEIDVVSFVENKLKQIKLNDKHHLENHLNENDLFETGRKKDLIMRISAMLEEEYGLNNPDNPRKYFWGISIDVEHIYPRNPAVVPTEEWSQVLNSIGNLVVLERVINQSIQNKPFNKKLIRYPESGFQIVKDIATNYIGKEWTIKQCEDRKKVEVEKLMKFFFEDLEQEDN